MAYTDLLFVFGFLPVYISLIFILDSSRKKNLASVIMSLIFLLWARPAYYALVMLDVFVVYIAGIIPGDKSGKIIKKCAVAAVGVSLIPLIAELACRNSIKGSVSAVGLFLLFLRSAIYLKGSVNGGERNLLDLAVYLISFEFMAVSPLLDYDDIKGCIKNRHSGLAMLASGIKRFICGLGGVVILGYSLERIRQAALFSGPVPYLNSLVGYAVTFVEIYCVVCGYLSMSEGLSLMSGYRIRMWDSSFTPRSLMKNHLGYCWLTLAARLNALIDTASPAVLCIFLAVSCVLIGAGLGLGAGTVSLVGIIAVTMILQSLFESEKSVLSALFTFGAVLIGTLLAATSSVDGLSAWFGGFSKNAYDFDMSFALYSELKRSLAWALAAVIYASPLKLFIHRLTRRIMNLGETAYGSSRVFGGVWSTAVLLLSFVAMISAGGAL